MGNPTKNLKTLKAKENGEKSSGKMDKLKKINAWWGIVAVVLPTLATFYFDNQSNMVELEREQWELEKEKQEFSGKTAQFENQTIESTKALRLEVEEIRDQALEELIQIYTILDRTDERLSVVERYSLPEDEQVRAEARKLLTDDVDVDNMDINVLKALLLSVKGLSDTSVLERPSKRVKSLKSNIDDPLDLPVQKAFLDEEYEEAEAFEAFEAAGVLD